MGLNNLTTEELGKLFPVTISEPMPEWSDLFNAEKIILQSALRSNDLIRIEHIGSTAIPKLKAKPTIDILLEIADNSKTDAIIAVLSSLNYQFIPKPENPPPHMMFVKGYTIHGFQGQAFHIHVRYHGDWDELHFRDYLKNSPETAKEYEVLKLQLAKIYRNDREAYTDSKTEFIKQVMVVARSTSGKDYGSPQT
jgi:GrpB-like predicted nucleotidyltransferase (UPF0157 family)